jgi:hypothetical protein
MKGFTKKRSTYSYFFVGVLAVALTVSTATAQQATVSNDARELLEWNEYYKLQWEDFEGLPNAEAIGDAATTVQIKAKPYYVKNAVKYDVIVTFNRKKSWVKDRSEKLLQHEQLHFDLAELYARKIRKRISELNDQNVKDIKVYNAAIRELLDESNAVDVRYDAETLHGAILDKQEEWEKKVKLELQLLTPYKKQKRVISTK